jgi:hypothetical protein
MEKLANRDPVDVALMSGSFPKLPKRITLFTDPAMVIFIKRYY